MTGDSRSGSTFHEKVAAATGLAGLLAEGALKRCCERANVELESMTARDLRRLLPFLEPILGLYLAAGELEASMTRLRQLADQGSAARRP